jgi:hypothetical protein
MAENAARLCDANNAEIFRLEDNLLRLAASFGEIPVVIHAYQGRSRKPRHGDRTSRMRSSDHSCP